MPWPADDPFRKVRPDLRLAGSRSGTDPRNAILALAVAIRARLLAKNGRVALRFDKFGYVYLFGLGITTVRYYAVFN